MNLRIERLGPSDRADAVSVLASAFHDYPVMRHVLRDAGSDYDERLRELIGFFCDKRLARGWPVLGIRSGESLVAAAGVNEPGDDDVWPAALSVSWENLRRRIGESAIDRLLAYDRESELDAPSGPHHFLGIIGVRTGLRGHGYGGALLSAVGSLADEATSSGGVWLNTEVASNVPFYRHHGYEVIAERDIGDVHTWCMLRPARR